MSWTRTVFGSRGRHLGRSRWPLALAIAFFGAVFSASGRLWPQTVLFSAAAVVLLGATIWSYRQ